LKKMDRRFLWAATLLVPFTAAVTSATTKSAESRTRVERGRYLVTALGCADCHAPKTTLGPNGPENDMTRYLSGHPEGSALPAPPKLAEGPWVATTSWDLTAWSGPWGVSYAINLTPDENTGIGSWSEETFVKAIRTGRHMGVSRPILPPMPWFAYRHLNDEDLKAVYAYLRSLPPVKNRVPAPVIAAEAATASAR
jgi:mono/diheme cytochrome c family protein